MKFKNITWKNFLSYGNKETSLSLDTNQSINITGTNGNGKSTFLDAFHFALTGKPYRKVVKGLLVNSTNKKDCVVALTIEHKGKNILVRRGIKPDIFEIHIDGIPLNEESKAVDFQTWLNDFLGINPKTLKDTLIISSTYYTPFLQMDASDKRMFVENILNIDIFSAILKKLKVQFSVLKEEKNNISKELEKLQSNLKILEDVVDRQQKDNKGKIIELQSEVKELETKIEKIEGENKKIDNEIKNISISIPEYEEKIKKLKEDKREGQEKYEEKKSSYEDYKEKGQTALVKVRTSMENINKNLKFFSDNKVCPTCEQKIDEQFQTDKINEFKSEIDSLSRKENEYKEKMSSLEKIKTNLIKMFDDLQLIQEEISKINIEMTKVLSSVQSNQRLINQNLETQTSYKRTINRMTNEIEELSQPKKEEIHDIKSIQDSIQQSNDLLTKKNKTFQAFDLAFSVLSDTGIKQYIIKKYIPQLNTFVNQFLEIFNAYYRVSFDENFDITIAIKGYDKLTYYSLSAGERVRCDLAVLFAFLNIAKLKNHISSNILIMDEIADANLDKAGLDGLINIINTLKTKGYTIFTISHRPELKEKFDVTYGAEKKVFSELKEI